jgi:hypothetical protein
MRMVASFAQSRVTLAAAGRIRACQRIRLASIVVLLAIGLHRDGSALLDRRGSVEANAEQDCSRMQFYTDVDAHDDVAHIPRCYTLTDDGYDNRHTDIKLEQCAHHTEPQQCSQLHPHPKPDDAHDNVANDIHARCRTFADTLADDTHAYTESE